MLFFFCICCVVSCLLFRFATNELNGGVFFPGTEEAIQRFTEL